MHTHTYVHEHTCATITLSTRWTTDTETHNLCTNMHTHTHTHVYKRMHIHIHTHMHIYIYIFMSAHIHTYTYIHARIQNVHMNARKARLKRRCGSDCAGSPSWRQEALPFSLSVAIRRGVPFVASSPIAREERRISAEQPQPTVAHRTITTARRPDHLRLSALVRSRSTQVTAHPSYQLGRGPPKRGHFLHLLPFWRVTRALYYKIAIYSNKRALYSAKRALYPDKRDPYSDKRALYSLYESTGTPY